MDVQKIDVGSGNIYLGGPPLVKAATGEVVTGEELGGAVVFSYGPSWNIVLVEMGDFTIFQLPGATMHCSVSGITDHFAKDEEESFAITR